MIVLKEQETAQNLFVTIDGCGADTIILIDEETNEQTIIETIFSIDKYYAVASVVLPIKQRKFYTLIIKNGEEIVYRDMIFCTNQTIETYTINKDVYTSNVSNNDFIIYE
jgi:hypothetical protein